MKLFYAILIAFVLSPAAFAQKITEKDLNGKWSIVAVTKEGAKVDFETGKITVPKNGKRTIRINRWRSLRKSLKAMT